MIEGSSVGIHAGITWDHSLVLKRGRDSSLRVEAIPIVCDERRESGLSELSVEALRKERDLLEKVVDAISEVETKHAASPDCVEAPPTTSAFAVMNRFLRNLRDIVPIVDSDAGAVRSSSHDYWHDGGSLACFEKYASTIGGFDPLVALSKLEQLGLEAHEEQSKREKIVETAEMREILLSALEEHRRIFSEYVSAVERLAPGIFDGKSYCRQLSGKYGESKLDYLIDPGNQCVLDSICDYLHASILQQQYIGFESDGEVAAYSHRRLGRYGTDMEIVLDPHCDLKLTLRSNFGYGAESYFYSFLSYRGVNAVNVPMLIFYPGARKYSCEGATYEYEVKEASFLSCLKLAASLERDLRILGEIGFVEKYFRRPLKDLSELLAFIVVSDKFLQISSLEKFDQLTSQQTAPLLPDEGFSTIDFVLDEESSLQARRIGALIGKQGVGDAGLVERARIELDFIVACHAKARGASGIQRLVSRELVRLNFVSGLRESNIDHRSVGNLAERVFPQEKDVRVRSYCGYELVEMRVKKAEAVLACISGIRKLSQLSNLGKTLSSLRESCLEIRRQALDYVHKYVEPELVTAIGRCAVLEKERKELRRLEKASKSSEKDEALRARMRKIEEELTSLSHDIRKRESEKKRLTDFSENIMRSI